MSAPTPPLEVIKQFEAANPNIHIEAEYGSSDGYHDKLATQLASGTAADIVQIDPETMPAFVGHRRLLPQLHGLRL